VDEQCKNIKPNPRRTSARLAQTTTRRAHSASVLLISYADDLNTLVVSCGTSHKEHEEIIKRVDAILDQEAATDHLQWDPTKDSRIDFHGRNRQSTVTLGILLNNRLDFQPHLDSRTSKAKRLLNVMTRLGNSNGGMSPRALRSLYTGCIRSIFAWGAELWNGPHTKVQTQDMGRIKYQCLRKITGAYHGSSKEKLGYIANIEPLQVKLDDQSSSGAARSLRTGDKAIRDLAGAPPAPGCTPWHNGTGIHGYTTDSPISSAFYIAPIPTPQSPSYRDRASLTPVNITHRPLIDPKDQRSKEKGYWPGTIGGLEEQGWKVIHTDGSGRKEGAASAMFSNPDEKATAFLGTYSTAADAERMTINLACTSEGSMKFILTDSQAALNSVLNISKGHAPRSGIEIRIKENLLQRSEEDTAIAWIRSYIGIPGNEKADR